MNETLQEFVDSRGVRMRVDRGAGVIRGVKILGLSSRNGRTYSPDALGKATQLYEGAKVNVNHAKGNPLGPRDYQDRIGVIRNVAIRSGDGLFADFHFNPKHALAEQLSWDAEHAPENVGFSHNVQARTARHGDRVTVEAIIKVQSVDLVADPATTHGLFEAAGDNSEAVDAGKAESQNGSDPTGLTVELLKQQHPELVETLLEERAVEIQKLREEIERLRIDENLRRKQDLARRLIAESGLPDPETAEGWDRAVVSRRFVDSLLSAEDEEAMRELVEERARLVKGAADRDPNPKPNQKPLSRDQTVFDLACPTNAKSFARAIT